MKPLAVLSFIYQLNSKNSLAIYFLFHHYNDVSNRVNALAVLFFMYQCKSKNSLAIYFLFYHYNDV